MSSRQTNGRIAVIVSVLLLSLVLRLRGLTARSIWFDEASAWAAVTQFNAAELLQSCKQNVHPPVWYFLLKSWVNVFGESLAALRGLSVLLGVATVAGAMGLAAESACSVTRTTIRFEAAVGAGLLMAISPLQILWSQQCRMYMLGAMLTLISNWLLLIAHRRNQRRYWSAYSISAILLLHTHNFGIFVAAAQAAYFGAASVLSWWQLRSASTNASQPPAAESTGLVSRPFRPTGRGLLFLFVIGLSYLPWMQVVRQQTARVREDYWIRPFEFDQIAFLMRQLFLPVSGEQLSSMLLEWTDWAIVIGIFDFLVFAIVLRIAILPALVALVSFGGGIAVSAWLTPLMIPRYFLFGHAALLVAVAVTVIRIPRRCFRISVAAILVLLSAATFLQLPSTQELSLRPGLSALIQRVLIRRQDDEPLLITSSFLFHAARYHVERTAVDQNVRVVLLRDNRNLRHYSGGPVIRSKDLLLPTALDSSDVESAWLIDTTGFSPWMERADLSPAWTWDIGSQMNERETSGSQSTVTAVRIIRE